YLGSHRGKRIGQEVADEYNKRFDVNMQGEDCGSEKSIIRILEISDVVMGTAKAGIQILSQAQLKKAARMAVAADLNAVPPLGIEGVDVNDMGKALKFTPKKAVGIGALAIGNIKYKVHYRMFELMMTTIKPLYLDHVQAFEAAREFAAQNAAR
ncbi:MAG: methylenetetrahydromethanopterin dehydrogenase, partial [Gammaproteobacteria bacterium]